MILDKDNLKAIKQADNISFRYIDGQHTIEPSKLIKDPVYGESTARVNLNVDGTVYNYEKT